jgi:pyruvate formate lyase activating enzyme
LVNLKRLHDEGFAILLRCPIIPGYNDREDHFKKIAEITKTLPNLLGAELLPYHNLGVSKNDRFGLKDEIKTIVLEQPGAELVEGWIQSTRDLGGRLINE